LRSIRRRRARRRIHRYHNAARLGVVAIRTSKLMVKQRARARHMIDRQNN